LTLDEVRAQVAKLFPPANELDAFSDAQLQQAQATAPLSLPPGFLGTVVPTLNRGSGSGVSGWTNAFILDVFAGDLDTRAAGTNLLTNLCNKMLAGQMRSPLWLLSRLVLIPKPPDLPGTGLPPHHCYRLLGAPSVCRRSSIALLDGPQSALRGLWWALPWHRFSWELGFRVAARLVRKGHSALSILGAPCPLSTSITLSTRSAASPPSPASLRSLPACFAITCGPTVKRLRFYGRGISRVGVGPGSSKVTLPDRSTSLLVPIRCSVPSGTSGLSQSASP
jgi:hypothetical protein